MPVDPADNAAGIMSDQRSTRRTIASSSDQKPDAPMSAPESEAPKEVASVIDEIEDLVVDPDVQIANAKKAPTPRERSQPVTIQPPNAFHLNENVDEKMFDIEELEQELDVAIAAELGQEETRTPTQTEEETEKRDEVSDLGIASRPTPKSESPQTPSTENQYDEPEQTRSNERRYTFAARLLAPCTRPVERLSPNIRILLNILVISTALWVPLVWLMVATKGFGLMQTGNLEKTPSPTTAVASEPTDVE